MSQFILYTEKNRSTPSQELIPQNFRTLPLHSVELYETTVFQLHKRFQRNQLSSQEYVKRCLERIHFLNPYLGAVIEVNPDAIDIAHNCDRMKRLGNSRQPLLGIPVLVKDNIATKDSMQTTAGSWALLGNVVPDDAHVVHKLRLAGAVIIGHANMSEWASARSKQESTGYSPRGGQCRNPYDLSVAPHGSSSGSAVAVAANIVPLAFGTETDSSIIGPASFNGVVGIKPTVGLTSRYGVIPESKNLDTVGCFGRTVACATHGLNAIVGEDPRDPATMVLGRNEEPDYTYFLSTKKALAGATFGLPMKRCWEFVGDAEKRLAEKVIKAIEAQGGHIVPVDFPSFGERIAEDGLWNWELGEPSKSEWTVVKADAYNGITEYLSRLKSTEIKTFEDIVAFNIQNRGTEGASAGDHPAFPSGQDNFLEIEQSKGVEDEIYKQALSHIRRQCRGNGIDGAMWKRTINDDGDLHIRQLDSLLLCDRKGVGQQIAAQAGYPVICIPIGVDDEGIPVSLSIHGSAWQDGPLVKWASAIEDLVYDINGHRPCPTFKNRLAKNIPVKWPS